MQADRVGKNRFGFSTLGLGKKQQNKIAPRFEKRKCIFEGSGPRPTRDYLPERAVFETLTCINIEACAALAETGDVFSICSNLEDLINMSALAAGQSLNWTMVRSVD